jgi:hypothetical protein
VAIGPKRLRKCPAELRGWTSQLRDRPARVRGFPAHVRSLPAQPTRHTASDPERSCVLSDPIRQRDSELRTLSFLARYFHSTAMRFDDRPHQTEAETDSAL